MTTYGRYRIIEAQTLETLKSHRILIETALRNRNLPPALRAELEQELSLALRKEIAARPTFTGTQGEEEDEDEDGTDTDGNGTEGGGSASGGAAGGDGGGMGHENEGNDSTSEHTGLSDLETIALLFFLTAQSVDQPCEAPAPVDYDEAFPLAAATLLFNREAKTAHIHEPYTMAQENTPDAPSDFLPSLEKHALKLGAHVMQLKVHTDAVSLFRKKGYEPHGPIISRRGAPLQRMRRTLSLNAPMPNDVI